MVAGRIEWVRVRSIGAAFMLVGVVLAAHSRAAEPDEDRLPIRRAERPLTLPRHVIRGVFAAGVEHASYTLDAEVPIHETITDVGFFFGAAGGISDDFELEASIEPAVRITSFEGPQAGCPVVLATGCVVAPLPPAGATIHTKAYFANPTIGATWRFVASRHLDAGARLTVSIPVDRDRYLGILPGFPVRLRFARTVRIDTGLALDVYLSPTSQPDYRRTIVPGVVTSRSVASPRLPLAFLVNPIDWLYLGADTGVEIGDVEDARQTTFVPLRALVGGTVPYRKRPLADIYLDGGFPALFTPGAAEKVHTAVQTIELGASFYFFP